MVLMVLDPISEYFAIKVSWFLELGIEIWNEFLTWAASLPFATLHPLFINLPMALTLGACILFLVFFLITKHKGYLYGMLISILTFQGFDLYHEWKSSNQHTLTIIQMENEKVICSLIGHQAFVLAPSQILNNSFFEAFYLNPYLESKRIRKTNFYSLPKGSNRKNHIWKIGSRSIGINNQENQAIPSEEMDIVISSKNIHYGSFLKPAIFDSKSWVDSSDIGFASKNGHFQTVVLKEKAIEIQL